MKISFSVDQEGFKELDEALGNLKKATARGVMRRTLQKAAKPIIEEANRLAPVDTGILARRITDSSRLSKRQARLNRRAESRSFSEVYVGPPGSSDISRMVEFGTSESKAQPYMRPAFDSRWRAALDIIKTELRVEINKAIDRATRRAERMQSQLKGR